MKVSGYVSYINREKDARSFAYPVFHDVVVPFSTNDRAERERAINELEQRLAGVLQAIEDGKETVRKVKMQVITDTTRLQAQCDLAPPKQRTACKKDIKTRMASFRKDMLAQVEPQISENTTLSKNITRDVKLARRALRDKKSDISQQTALETRCHLGMHKAKGESEVDTMDTEEKV